MKKLFLFIALLFVSLASKAQCPTAYTLYLDSAYCGGAAPDIMLSNSESGVSYQLYYASAAVGSPISGSTGSALNFGACPLYSFSAGYINVVGTHTTSSCSVTMRDSVNLIWGVPSAIYGPSHVCIGDSVIVIDTASATGTWSSSNPSVASVNGISGSSYGLAHIYGISMGSTTITYSVTSTCGTHFVTRSIIVDTPTSVSISGPTSICLGVAASYTASFGGGYWSSSSPTVATITYTGTVVGISAGTTTITYTTYTGCSWHSATMSITVGSTSSGFLSHPFALLGGDTTTVTASISSPTWGIYPATVASITSSGLVTGISAGMSTIYCVSSSSCATSILPILPAGSAIADSFYVIPTHNCSGPLMNVVTNSPTASLHLKTYYGDGTIDYRSVGSTLAYSSDTFSHAYATSGTYTIKQVLYYGSVPTDSVSYSYSHVFCRDIALSLHYDVNANCTYESGTDFMNSIPVQVEVDSMGVVMDTMSITSGLFYQAYGAIGDVYRFRVLSPYLYPRCPSSGLIFDTLTSTGYSTSNISVPLMTTSSSGFDLTSHSAVRAGRHLQNGDIVISNPLSTASSAIVTLRFNPRYSFINASITPVSVTSGIATWYLSSVSASATPIRISYQLDITGGASSWFTVGDTIRTTISVVPTSGDVDTTNNYIYRVDTANASYDPNYTAVTPQGNILNNTTLHYTVHFENDGNDTAHNIYVMDTLSDNVDPSTLNIEMATAAMNVTYLRFGTHTAVKFEFPNIKLLDSSHHGLCTGFVSFNVKTRPGLADGTLIPNRAGIYFDDNEVVMTNSVNNIIVIPSVSITTPDSTICLTTDTALFTAIVHSIANTHYQWFVNSTPAGTDTPSFTSTTLSNWDLVKCLMIARQDNDSVVLLSNTIMMRLAPHPTAGTITGPSSVCVGATATLSDSVYTGVWSVTNGTASISSTGMVTGVSGGIDTVVYTVSNICATATTSYPITINNTTSVSDSISVTRDSVCAGDTVTFTVYPTNGGSTPFYQWQKFGVNVDTGVTFTYVPTLSDVITCNMTSSVICPTPAITTSNSITMLVTPNLTPTVSIIASPVDTITYLGQLVTFYTTVTYGGTATTYQWYNNGSLIPGATSSTYNTSVYSNDSVYCSITSNVPCATSNTATSNTIIIYADYLGIHNLKTTNGSFTLFPNPNNGSFTLTGEAGDEAINYEVHDVTGKVVMYGVAMPVNGRVVLDVNIDASVPSGNYFMRIVNAKGASLLPFVKK